MNKKVLMLLVLLLFSGTNLLFSQKYELTSFDKNIKVTVTPLPKLSWSVQYKDQLIIDHSEIGMELNSGKVLGHSAIVSKAIETFGETTINPVVSQKNNQVKDRYKQLSLEFTDGFSVEFRAYDEGVAYRFITALGDNETIIKNEIGELNFPPNTTSLFPLEESLISHYERSYIPTKLDTLSTNEFCSLPVLMEVNNVKVVVTESDLYDYPGMFLYGTQDNGLKAGFPNYVLEAKPAPGAEDRNEVITSADYIAKTTGNRSFPWRTFVITDDDKKILESELVFKLSRPLAIQDTEWIKPGKVAWDWYNANNIYGVDFKSGINTETYKYYIDFASEYKIEY